MKYQYILTLSLLIFFGKLSAQENYSSLTKQAIKIINAQDSTKYKQAYDLIENTFKRFPDSINGTGLYYASVLNSELKNYDKAFEYLTPLTKMEKDDDGYPGWSFVLDEYAEKDYKNLINDNRWGKLKIEAQKDSLKYFKKLEQKEQEFFKISNIDIKNKTKNSLYQSTKTYNPYLYKEHRNYSIGFKINDTTETSYLVHLPNNYNPQKEYPVLFFLHGAVRFSKLEKYKIPEIDLGGWNRYYTKYGNLNEVILVFPSANKQYNWMTSDDGFFIVPKIVKAIKESINIDDNKIFISGHSNGATGSFSYLIKQPTQFAGFYGFNTHPKVYTGGTFVENILNRSYINFSTDQDYYYPPNANDKLDKLMDSLQLDYKDYRYEGFPHWFPEYDESEEAYKILFKDLKNRERNPFPEKISWEFDDEKYGNIDWLTNIKLDTLKSREIWQEEVNFSIKKWLKYNENDSLITETVKLKAFDFPRRSGKIIAEYNDNVFQIKTSRIKSFKINISPEMINLKRKVRVYINGNLYFKGRVKYDNDFMIQNFKENKDRKQVWINQIQLEL